MKKTYSFVFMIVLVLLIVLAMSIGESRGETITVAPASPEVKYCYPFGMGTTEWYVSSTLPWTPYGGFIYQNVPPFDIEVGDTIAFDLGAPNDFDIALDIAMAPTTENGGTQEAEAFIKVVSKTHEPANPRGDAITGNYELQFRAEVPFAFRGGGLIIRFSNPSADYQNDDTCDLVMVNGDSSDTSGYFVERFFRDTDGISPGKTNLIMV